MKKNNPDYILLIIIGILVIFGLIMISSASIGVSQEKYQESYYFVKNQISHGLIPGIFLGILAYFLPLEFWKKFSLLFLCLSFLGLILVFVPGIGLSHGGAHRWIKIFGTSFQPSELIKLPLIIYLSAWLSKKGDNAKSFKQCFVPFVILISIIGLLLLKQPDLGTFGVIGLTSLSIFFLTETKISHTGLIIIGASIIFLFSINFFPHASKRLQVFLNPKMDPQGLGYQTKQAELALGSGGFFGVGLSQGLQKFKYLPEPASDSIAAVIGEELGFLGLFCLILLFLMFAIRGLKISKKAPDQFSKLLAGGITIFITIQALINIAAICGLMPLTGIPMPFVSLGGTSLAISLASIGILIKISTQTQHELKNKKHKLAIN